MIPLVIYDIACNAKTKKTALLSVTDTTAYHLFDSTNWQIMKKAKWHGQHKGILELFDIYFNTD